MTATQPIIDRRDQQQLVEQLYQLLKIYCPEWQNREALSLDRRAEALVQIFARLGETVIQHLNRIPEQNRLTFLDLMGVELKPPQVARAPLCFTLANGSGSYGFVPAGTQVAADDVVFETVDDLTVILPQIVRAVSVQPGKDRWLEHQFATPEAKAAKVFAGTDLILRRLYLGHGQLFDLKGNTIVSLQVDLKEEYGEAWEAGIWEVKWYCFMNGQPTCLTPFGVDRAGKENNNVVNLLQSGMVYFNNISKIDAHPLHGIEQQTTGHIPQSWLSRWIYAELCTPVTQMATERLTQIRSLKAAVNFISAPMGRGKITSQGTDVLGKKTNFTAALNPGDLIIAQNQTRIIKSVLSDALLTVNDIFAPDLTAETDFYFAKFGTGTLACKRGSRNVVGKATLFTVELQKGDFLIIGVKIRQIDSIDGDNQLTINEPLEQDVPEGTIFSYMSTPKLQLEQGFVNQTALDITKDFYPFGTAPQFNDTFLLGSQEVFSKQGAELTLRVELSKGSRVYFDSIVLSWEYWDGRSWTVLGETGSQATGEASAISDSSKGFTQNGSIRFSCPKIEPLQVNGVENYWLRVRMISGNYGTAAQYFEQAIAGDNRYLIIIKDGRKYKRIPTEDGGFAEELLGPRERTEWIMNPATLSPPSFKSLLLEYRYQPVYQDLDYVLTYNDFFYQNQTTQLVFDAKSSFAPFCSLLENQPAFYLAFNQPMGDLPLALYWALEDLSPTAADQLSFDGQGPRPGATRIHLKKAYHLETGEPIELRNLRGESERKSIVAIERGAQWIEVDTPIVKDFSETGSVISRIVDPTQIVWEYWNGRKWVGLSVTDGTENLAHRDIVSILLPNDLSSRYLFGQAAYWLRIRMESGVERKIPALSGIYGNAVWARHLRTIRQETLGSSNGMPNQSFQLIHAPVLPGQAIWVRETGLTAESQAAIITAENQDAIDAIYDVNGNLSELWVRWHEVGRFSFSEAQDRHYQIDRITGKITFGDAVHGLIPPVGVGNIQCRQYQSGGGSVGNVATGKLTKLRTTYPYIKGVTNPVAAAGGSDLESLDRARLRGPYQIRHRQRAISASDCEWLIREADSQVNKVKCLANTNLDLSFEAGKVTMIIVPDSTDPAPFPSQELLSRIAEQLTTQQPAELSGSASRIGITGPRYLQVGVNVGVQFTSIGAAKQIEGRIVDRLKAFFHPLTGGPAQEGWEFGRPVYRSEVYQVVEQTPGVDYVTDLLLRGTVQSWTLQLQSASRLERALSRGVNLSDRENRLSFVLAESLSGAATPAGLAIVGFKVGDTVMLSTQSQNALLTLSRIDGDLLEGFLDGATSEVMAFPPGSMVETVGSERYIKSFLVNEVIVLGAGALCQLKVAIFEAGDECTIEGTAFKGVIKSAQTDRIFLEEYELVCAGAQQVNGVLEVVFPYLVDLNFRLCHDLQQIQPDCGLERIPKLQRFYLKTAATELLEQQSWHYCPKCFPKQRYQ